MFLLWLILGVIPLVWLGTILMMCLMELAQLSENRAGRRELSDADGRFLRSCGITTSTGSPAAEEEAESCREVGLQR